jgi:adenosylcobinamide-GDP ribazoletransferase
MVKRLLAAVALLTRVPVRRELSGEDVGRATVFFPLVGAGIGLVQLVCFRLLAPRLPSLPVAVLVVAVSAWLTRALHLDGVVDFADGLGGGATRDETLAIMRDPRAGSFGVVAVVLVLAAKIAAVDALRSSQAVALVLAPALARWGSVPLSFACAYAREGGGLGAALTDHVGVFELLGSSVISAALVWMLAPRVGLVSVGAVAVATIAVGAIARSRLGGVTGDVLGAQVEISEAAALVATLLT